MNDEVDDTNKFSNTTSRLFEYEILLSMSKRSSGILPVEGDKESTPIETTRSSEQSKSNLKEVRKVESSIHSQST